MKLLINRLAIIITASFLAIGVTQAGSLSGALDSVSSAISGDGGDALLDAALSKAGISNEVVSQVKPVINGVVSKGKALASKYNYSPEDPDQTSAEDLEKMKSEMGDEIENSKSTLGGMVPADKVGPLIDLIKSQLPSGLL